MRIDAYVNLNDDCISVKSREPETRGLVVDHVDRVIVTDVEFVVQPGGRKRVLEEKRKNVHAFVRGKRGTEDDVPASTGLPVTYNPYEYENFVTRADEQSVQTADVAIVTTDGVTAFGIHSLVQSV